MLDKKMLNKQNPAVLAGIAPGLKSVSMKNIRDLIRLYGYEHVTLKHDRLTSLLNIVAEFHAEHPDISKEDIYRAGEFATRSVEDVVMRSDFRIPPVAVTNKVNPNRFLERYRIRSNLQPISAGDAEFLKRALEKFNISKIAVKMDPSKAKYPDIWVDNGNPPTISVTAEWASHDDDLRRSQLVHEMLHLKGLEHGIHEGLDYNTHPQLDDYSKAVYQKLFGNSRLTLQNTIKNKSGTYFIEVMKTYDKEEPWLVYAWIGHKLLGQIRGTEQRFKTEAAARRYAKELKG